MRYYHVAGINNTELKLVSCMIVSIIVIYLVCKYYCLYMSGTYQQTVCVLHYTTGDLKTESKRVFRDIYCEGDFYSVTKKMFVSSTSDSRDDIAAHIFLTFSWNFGDRITYRIKFSEEFITRRKFAESRRMQSLYQSLKQWVSEGSRRFRVGQQSILQPPVPYDHCVSVPISRLLTVGSMSVQHSVLIVS